MQKNIRSGECTHSLLHIYNNVQTIHFTSCQTMFHLVAVVLLTAEPYKQSAWKEVSKRDKGEWYSWPEISLFQSLSRLSSIVVAVLIWGQLSLPSSNYAFALTKKAYPVYLNKLKPIFTTWNTKGIGLWSWQNSPSHSSTCWNSHIFSVYFLL